ncbi:MAG: HEAT repeat domain-containing protein [Proteobacteria bacterium]|nr:HEAT repeat domain-containing protein [Pseudomonadota bacterium]
MQLGAAEALAKLGRPEGAPALRARLAQQPDPAVRLMAAQVLTGLGDPLGPATLQASLRDATSSTRAGGTRARRLDGASGGAGPRRAAPATARPPCARPPPRHWRGSSRPDRRPRAPRPAVGQAALERGDWAMRYAALDVASELDPELAAELLGWALRHGDAGVRSAAARRLGELGPPAAGTALLRAALRDQEVEVRAAAASALARTGDPTAAPALASLARETDPQIALSAAAQLWRAGDATQVAVLLQATQASATAVRRAAVAALALVPLPEARALLAPTLRDRDPQVRYAAALALAPSSGSDQPRALAELRSALQRRRGDPLAIVRALAQAGDAAQPLLAALARDGAATRRAAAQTGAAELLPPAAAVAVLRRGARDPDAAVRRASAHGLLRLAGSTPPAAAALHQLVRTPIRPCACSQRWRWRSPARCASRARARGRRGRPGGNRWRAGCSSVTTRRPSWPTIGAMAPTRRRRVAPPWR